MAEGESRLVGPSYFWNLILSNAFRGTPAKTMYDEIRSLMQANNLRWRGNVVGPVSKMRGTANRITRAAARIKAAPPGTTIDESMIAPWVGFVPTTASNLNPRYDVRWEHRVIRDGEELTQWRTWADYPNPFIDTSVLQDQLDAVGLYLAKKYKVQHVGVGSWYIVQMPGS